MSISNKKRTGGAEALGKKRQGIALSIVAAVILLVLAGTFGVMFLTEQRAHSSAEKLVGEVVSHINDKLDGVKNAARGAAVKAKRELDDPDALEQLVREFVEKNSFIYGSTVAFEPYAFPDKGRCFAPYSWKTSDGKVHSRQLGTETDYYLEEWYAETKLGGKEYWCEPYFDEGGAKIMMCTFSIPLTDADGNLVAVLTADVGLEDLQEYISTISPYRDSYIVLRSMKGSVLANGETAEMKREDTIIVTGKTQIGWTVELNMPFTFLVRGDNSIFFTVGSIFALTAIFVYLINRTMYKMQERASKEYMDVIDAISSGFSSIYLIDLLTNETVVFRDPAGYSEIIGEIRNEKAQFKERMTRLIDYDCYTPDRERMLWEISQEAIRRKLSHQNRYEVRFRKEINGVISWNEMNIFCMERDSKERPRRAVVAFTDVTESVLREKETQETLERALETAQSASKAKTDFLFNMSHDIRTPMNAIIGFTNMAIKHIDDRERVKDSLAKTQEAGELLLSLINDILDMSRIESGKITLEENFGDVYLSFSNIESTMREMAATKNIDISFEISNITDRYVYADFSRCIRVFVNIITNAIKYTKTGGRIRVKATQIDSRKDFGVYQYTFEDNGIGMSEEFQEHMFDEFTREETTTVSGIQGTGLGLAVCRTFVHAMGGTIECRSTQGVGSTFTITLPLRIQEGSIYTNPVTGQIVNGELPQEEEKKPADFSGRRALLVEDNELNREIAVDILSEEGMQVETANDGSVAVDLLREKGPDYYDFILMDIQMPIMDGYEATKQIRAMYPGAVIPIIALSANAFEEDRLKSVAAGMNDHVAKPINVPVLNATLEKYL